LSHAHTIRHLKPTQIYHQIRHRLVQPIPVLSVVERPRPRKLHFLPWIQRPKSYFGKGSFKFLNKERSLGWPPDWNATGCSRLWQYNLHYFDYVHQQGIDRSTAFELIRNWMKGHPVKENGVGWEPYPTSLRLVNWIKFCALGDDAPEDIRESLMLQAVNLRNRVEYHLLGNHLWANGKALWFAGAFLGMEKTASLGRKIVSGELKQQFLLDGGHFELSPMYHSIILEDLLDLINLCQASGTSSDAALLPILQEAAEKSLAWLQAIVDEKGDIPLLNDSAHGIAPRFDELRSYARRLGVSTTEDGKDELKIGPWTGRNLSGYLVLKKGPFRLIFDTAILGPDYLPGHAHCDMLSVLLDFGGRSVWTDTGVFEYEEGERRLYSRGTSAHNTLVLDGLEQAEIWKSFRVGRRGHPKGFSLGDDSVECSHTGFEIWKKGLVHSRSIQLRDDGFEIVDRVGVRGKHSYKAFFHFHPEAKVVSIGEGYLINEHLSITPSGAKSRLTTSEYYPEFGRIEERPCMVLEGEFSDRSSFGVRCTYCS
jgi:uncharacterized heparinase superfamily protein